MHLRSLISENAARRVATGIAAVAPLAFMALALSRAAPFLDDVPLPPGTDWVRYDDWESYRAIAVSILTGGLLIPAIDGPYIYPRGFLYNYFVAGVFAIGGVNASLVYVVQSAMLGLAVSLAFFTLRSRLSGWAGLVLVLALGIELYVELFRTYAFRLLSENLTAFAVATCISALATAGPSRLRNALAGVSLGGLFLVRPPALVAIAGVIVAAFIYRRIRASGPAHPLWIAGAFLCVAAALPLRDFLVTGQLGFATLTDPTSLPVAPEPGVLGWLEFQSRHVLFTLGFTTAMGNTDFRWRYQWMAIWLGLLIYIIARIRSARVPAWWEIVTFLIVVLYVVPVTILGVANNYGGRMVAVIVPFVIPLLVTLADDVFAPRRRSA